MEIVIDGESSIIGQPSAVVHVPFKKMHIAITNKEGVRMLVCRVHTKGEPVRYLEEGARQNND